MAATKIQDLTRVTRLPIKLDKAEYAKRLAQTSDVKDVIDEPFLLRDPQGIVRAICVHLDELEDNTYPIEQACMRIPYENDFRQGYGLNYRSKSIGWMPRVVLRRDFCTVAQISKTFPAEHATLCSGVLLAQKYYRRLNPEQYDRHLGMTISKVRPEYQLHGTAFTSGIVNDNNPLAYHHDSGNFPEAWSAMLVMQIGVSGGHLNLPEYDIGVKFHHPSLFMFNGAEIMHGVTPISVDLVGGHRFSVVYYSLKGMWNCLGVDEEAKRIQKLRTEREEKRTKLGVKPRPDYLKGRKLT